MKRSILLLSLLTFGLPAKAAEPEGRSIGLEWEQEKLAQGYELRFERTGFEEKPLFFKTKSTSFSGMLKPGEYRFYLRAYDKGGKPGDWSEPESIAVKPLVVEATFPKPEDSLSSKDFPDNEIEFQWRRGGGETEYEFRLANADNSFVRVLKVKDNFLKLKLPPGNVFRWSIQAITSGGTQGDSWELPATFEFVSPQLGVPVFAKDTRYDNRQLSWSAVPGAQTYSAKLMYQELLSDEWSSVEQQTELSRPHFAAKSTELKPGRYKLSVLAKARGWKDSQATEFTFLIKPVERVLTSIPDEISNSILPPK